MNSRKIVIGAALVLIGLPIVLVLIVYGSFYAVFYFPNWTSATSGTIVSSAEKREYLLYVPKSYNGAKPTPLVINLRTAMSWPTSSMNISQWNLVADEHGFIVVYPAGTGFGPKSWEMVGSETPSRMPDVTFISALIKDADLRKRDVERRRHGVRAVLHAVRPDRGDRDGFGWAIPGVELVPRPSTDAGDCVPWNRRSYLPVQRRSDKVWRRHISERSELYGELGSAKPVRTESDRICGRCGCHAPPIHGLR
jgi:hypothetical protein